jgi:hypothetical protein
LTARLRNHLSWIERIREVYANALLWASTLLATGNAALLPWLMGLQPAAAAAAAEHKPRFVCRETGLDNHEEMQIPADNAMTPEAGDGLTF